MIIIGVDNGSQELLQMSGLKARRSERDDLAEDYASNFYGTPVFSHVAWGAVLLIGMALALRDLRRGARRADLIAVVAMGVAAFLYVAAFFVISGACDYRYMYFLDVAAMAMLVHRAALPRPP
jgi:cation transport ATPase